MRRKNVCADKYASKWNVSRKVFYIRYCNKKRFYSLWGKNNTPHFFTPSLLLSYPSYLSCQQLGKIVLYFGVQWWSEIFLGPITVLNDCRFFPPLLLFHTSYFLVTAKYCHLPRCAVIVKKFPLGNYWLELVLPEADSLFHVPRPCCTLSLQHIFSHIAIVRTEDWKCKIHSTK